MGPSRERTSRERRHGVSGNGTGATRPVPSVPDALLVAGLALAIVIAFAGVASARGFRLPLGSDTPVYVWWARRAQAFGLGAADTGGRPALVGALAALEAVLPAGMSTVAAAVGPVLAAVTGVGTAALVHVALGAHRLRFLLVAAFTASFLSLLVPGYFSTLAFAALFVAALACLGRSFGAGRWGSVAAAAALGGVAGLSHPIFLAVGAAVLAGGVAALLPALARDRTDGRPVLGTAAGRTAVAAAGSLAVFGAGLAAVGLPPDATLVTSRDAFLRRVGLGGLVERSFTAVLRRSFPWWRSALVTAGAVLGAAPLAGEARRADALPGGDRDRRRWFAGILLAWLAVTVGAVAALLAGFGVPGQRFAQLALPLPVLAALGLLWLREPLSPFRGSVVLALGSLLFVGVAWLAWWDVGPLVPEDALDQARGAAAVAAAEPPGTPVVLVADDATGSPARFLVRYLNYVRAELPPDRTADLFLWVGSAEDFTAGRLGLTGQVEHDRFATFARPPPGGPPPLGVVLEALDPSAFDRAVALPATVSPHPGVAVLPAPDGSPRVAPAPGQPAAKGVGEGSISRWTPVWSGTMMLALLLGLGWPWARAVLRHAHQAVRTALTPAFGLAALAVAAVGLDALGVRATAASATAALVLVTGAGLGTATAAARRDRRSASR